MAQNALREACSSIVMKLLGRSLVVTADVLMDYSRSQLNRSFEVLANHVNDPGGIAQFIADISNVDQTTAAELIQETFLIAAEIFEPLPSETRARIRDLLYDLIDTMPPTPDADWIEDLKQDLFIPDETELLALASELSGSLLWLMERFLVKVLSRVVEIILEEMSEMVEVAVEQVQQYLAELAKTVADLYAACSVCLPK